MKMIFLIFIHFLLLKLLYYLISISNEKKKKEIAKTTILSVIIYNLVKRIK